MLITPTVTSSLTAPCPAPPKNPVEKAVTWMDDYTSARETTGGNFKSANYFQAFFQGGTEGYYLMGPAGVVAGAGSALTGSFIQNKTGSQVLGVVCGTAVGAALGTAVGALSGQPLVNAGVLGGLLGGFQTIRSDGRSEIRDAGGNATMISAFFIDGPAKVAGGIGAAAGARYEKGWQRALIGAGVGAATGAGLAAIGFAPATVPVAALGAGLAGAVGPFFGPRFSQFFRNLAEDSGKGMEWVGMRTGLARGPIDEKYRNAMGAVPAAFIKEGLRGFMYSDGGLSGFVIGGAMESVQQAHIMFFSEKDAKGKPGDESVILSKEKCPPTA